MAAKVRLYIVAICIVGVTGILWAQPEPMYIQGGTIFTMAGEVIEDGILRLEEGKITYVGRRITIPKDAIVLEAVDKYITPGFILAHSAIGTQPEAGQPGLNPVTPGFQIYDTINLNDPEFAEAASHGVTSINIMPVSRRPIPGVGTVMKTLGRHYEDQVVNKVSALGINLIQVARVTENTRDRSLASEVEAIILIRNWFREASRIQAAREDIQIGYSDFDIDGHTLMLLRAINKEIPVFIYANSPTEIERGISLFEDYDLQAVFVGMSDIDKLWDRFISWQPDLLTGSLDVFSTGGWLKPITLTLVDSLLQRNFRFQCQVDQFGMKGQGEVRNIMHQAAILQQAGLSQTEALKTITAVPAKLLGVDDRLGTIEVGKDADLNIFSEPPLEILSLPDIVMINGQIVNEPRR